jgi:hypothetical protein
MAEIKQDPLTLGGSMLYKLIHRSFPGWFKYNSFYVMQPMYTPAMNAEIAKEFGTFDQFSLEPPGTPAKLVLLNTHAAISAVLENNKAFKVKYGQALPDLIFADFMLSGDCPANIKNRTLANTTISAKQSVSLIESWTETMMDKILRRETYTLGKTKQVDIAKE